MTITWQYDELDELTKLSLNRENRELAEPLLDMYLLCTDYDFRHEPDSKFILNLVGLAHALNNHDITFTEEGKIMACYAPHKEYSMNEIANWTNHYSIV